MKKLPIFTIWFMGKLGTAVQPVKAATEEDAKKKFLKRYPKKTDDDIFDVGLLEPTEKHYRLIASGAF